MAQIKALPLELQKIAESELGEVVERIPDDLLALKTWIQQQPHLNARLDDQFLIQFLRGCKYSLERAKEKIDLFFTLKSKYPSIFNLTDINEEKFREIANYGFGLPLPRPLNDNGPRIYVYKAYGDVAKGNFDAEVLYSEMMAQHEIFLMDDPYACVNGIVYIWDLEHATINFAAKFTPSLLKKVVQYLEKSLPFRIKGAHLINVPTLFNGVLNILLSLFSEKLKQRISINGQSIDNLLKIIPNKYLPKYLGGENGSMEEQRVEFDKKWLEYADYFKANENYGTNELLRPGKPIDFDSQFGLGGSFRKLDVD